MIFKYINPYIFLLSFFVGMFIVYTTSPAPEIIYQYPTPENSNSVYQDSAGLCYKMKGKQVKCPNDIKKIEPYHIQNSEILKNNKN